MSNGKEMMVTPTGRIVFIKNLFEPNNKDRYTASLIFDDSQDLKKIQSLLMKVAKARFDEKIIKSKKFKWGLKTPDEEAIEQYDFFDENTLILNASTKFEVEVKGPKKGPDGKFEDLIDGDIKAGDYCRFLISAYAWENTDEGTNRGVSINLTAVQLIKEGEALYSRTPSDDIFGEAEVDIEVDLPETDEDSAGDEEEDMGW